MLITTKQLSDETGISVANLLQLKHRGVLKGEKVGKEIYFDSFEAKLILATRQRYARTAKRISKADASDISEQLKALM